MNLKATIAAPQNSCQRTRRNRRTRRGTQSTQSSASEFLSTRTALTAHLQARAALRRMNLQIRMGTRRFTRLTNAHSKKIQNHVHALALYYMFYNFARIHQTLRVTPAIQAGAANHVRTIEEIIGLLD